MKLSDIRATAKEQLEKGNPYHETVCMLSEQLEETDRKLKEAMKQ